MDHHRAAFEGYSASYNNGGGCYVGGNGVHQHHHNRRGSSPELIGGGIDPSLAATTMGVGGTNPGGSMVLGQYRRHSASLSAAPIRGSQFDGRPTRSNSWAPDSPKKARTTSNHRKGSGQRGRLIRHLEESVFSMKALRNNRKELVLWAMMCAAIVVGYKLWSDGGFSAILTLSSCFQCFALILVLAKVLGQRSVNGVSRRSLILIMFSLCCRLTSTLFYNGYLPVDKSGDWVYQAADALSVLLCMILLLYGKNETAMEKDNCYIAIPCCVAIVLGVLIHPTLNQNFVADVSWTIGLYVETFAMVPQLWLMTRIGGEVEALTSHYVASMTASKFFAWLFWYFSYTELVPRTGGKNYAGWAVIGSYTAQTLLFGDFFYYYVKSLRVGKSMIIDF